VVAILSTGDGVTKFLQKISAENSLTNALGETGFYLLGVAFFAVMGWMLYRVAMKRVV
jgi:hypothetical protein